MKHLVTDISGHGLGHLAQAAPVVSRLASMLPGFHLTIRSSLAEKLLREWIRAPFDYIRTDLDPGMVMQDAITVDVDASCAWYESFQADYEERLKREIHTLEKLHPDLLLSDIPWIGLEAAHRLGIPSIALCSLNWSDTYRHFCHQYRKCEGIADRILSAYASADLFLQPQPAMPMNRLGITKLIPPIARVGKTRKADLRTLAARRASEKFILLSIGGIGMQFPEEILPVLDDTTWIVPDSFETTRKDVITQSRLDLHYIDLLASVDLVLTKTGYGALVEAVVNQVPVLCIERPGWPEEPGLFAWCREHGYFEQTLLGELGSDATRDAIMRLINTSWIKDPVIADGDQHAANVIASYMQEA